MFKYNEVPLKQIGKDLEIQYEVDKQTYHKIKTVRELKESVKKIFEDIEIEVLENYSESNWNCQHQCSP